jgi:deoxyadenosine/deoxycytidine kinase
MLKIGFCGAHGTGKTTIARIIAENYDLKIIEGTMRNMWKKFGISDFEKLPADVRKTFQYYAILTQIEREEEVESGFVTDRTVLDNLAYTVLSAELNQVELRLYEALTKERLKNYTHFIYVPVEFKAEYEHLRADPETQAKLAGIIEEYLPKMFSEGSYLVIKGDIETRKEQIKNFLENNSQKLI